MALKPTIPNKIVADRIIADSIKGGLARFTETRARLDGEFADQVDTVAAYTQFTHSKNLDHLQSLEVSLAFLMARCARIERMINGESELPKGLKHKPDLNFLSTLVMRGEYEAGKTYHPGDMVMASNSTRSWYCTEPTKEAPEEGARGWITPVMGSAR